MRVGTQRRRRTRTALGITTWLAVTGLVAGPASAAAMWTVSPGVNSAVPGALDELACPTATTCFAIGYSGSGVKTTNMAERWNGTRWSAVTGTKPKGFLSCPTATSCFAAVQRTMEHWDGTTWSTLPGPPVNGTADLSCPSTTSCTAVGNALDASGRTLIQHWDGTTWSEVASPNPGSVVSLFGVDCLRSTSCYAVGEDAADVAIAERWNGTKWSLMTMPKSTHAVQTALTDLACTSTASCFAVGDSFDGHKTTSMAERWNGSKWSIMPIVAPAGAANSLSRVSCSSAANCFAVGINYVGGARTTLIEHSNGKSWSVSPSPNPAGGADFAPGGISCPRTTECFAVGRRWVKAKTYPLIERYR